MVERDRERKQKEFDKKLKSNSDLFNEDTDSESENFEPRKNKYKSRKTLDSSDSEGKVTSNKVKCVFPVGCRLYTTTCGIRTIGKTHRTLSQVWIIIYDSKFLMHFL